MSPLAHWLLGAKVLVGALRGMCRGAGRWAPWSQIVPSAQRWSRTGAENQPRDGVRRVRPHRRRDVLVDPSWPSCRSTQAHTVESRPFQRSPKGLPRRHPVVATTRPCQVVSTTVFAASLARSISPLPERQPGRSQVKLPARAKTSTTSPVGNESASRHLGVAVRPWRSATRVPATP